MTELNAVGPVDPAKLAHIGSEAPPRVFGLWKTAFLGISWQGPTAGSLFTAPVMLSLLGPAMVWVGLLCVAGLLVIMQVWREVVSKYPLQGGPYQWARELGGNGLGHYVGLLYVFCDAVIIVILGLVATVVLNGLFSSFTVTTQHQIFVTIGLIIVGTAVALGNTRLLGVITAVSVGIELTILLGVSLILLVFHTHHSPTALFHTYGALHGAGAWSAFATAVVTICVILVGSETAGIYAEEVTDSHVVSGKAMVTACLAVALSVFFFMVAMTLSTPDLHQAVADPETWILGTVQSGLGTWAAKLFFTGALIAVLATTLATIAGGSRILFGMAREGQLPGASVLGRLNGSGTPMYATLVFAVLSVIPLFEVSKSLVLADAVSGLVLSAYVLTLGALVVARAKGWHSETFSFGAWAWPVTGAAFAVAFVLCLDTAWPRASTNPNLGGVPVLWDVWIGLAVLSPILWFLSRSSRTAVAKLDTQSSNLTASSE